MSNLDSPEFRKIAVAMTYGAYMARHQWRHVSIVVSAGREKVFIDDHDVLHNAVQSYLEPLLRQWEHDLFDKLIKAYHQDLEAKSAGVLYGGCHQYSNKRWAFTPWLESRFRTRKKTMPVRRPALIHKWIFLRRQRRENQGINNYRKTARA